MGGILQWALEQPAREQAAAERQQNMQRLQDIADRQNAVQQFHTLREVLSDPDPNRRDALLDYWGQSTLGKDVKPQIDVFRKIIKDSDDKNIQFLRDSLGDMSGEVAKGGMTVEQAYGMFRDPLKTYSFLKGRAVESKRNELMSQPEPGQEPPVTTARPLINPQTGQEQGPMPVQGQQRSPAELLEAGVTHWRGIYNKLSQMGDKEGAAAAEKNVSILENRLTRAQKREEGPTNEVGLAYKSAQGDTTASAAIDILEGSKRAGRQETMVELAKKAQAGDKDAVAALKLLKEPRQENEADRVSMEMFDQKKYEELSSAQQTQVNKMIQLRRVEVAAAGAAATNAARPLDDQDKQALAAHNNILASIRQVRDFTPAEIKSYAGLLNRPQQEVKLALQGMAPGMFGSPDERFLQFKALMGRLQGTAFGEAGKQLTGIEQSVVNQYTPTGREAGGAPEILAKINNLESFTRLARATRLRMATQAKGNIDPDDLDREIEKAADRAGLLRGAAKNAATPKGKSDDVDAARKRLGID